MTLGESLRAARRKNNLTGIKVAAFLQIMPASYRRYERDEVDPATKILTGLTRLYNCSYDALINHGGESQDGPPHHAVIFEVTEGQSFTIEISARVASAEKAVGRSKGKPSVAQFGDVDDLETDKNKLAPPKQLKDRPRSRAAEEEGSVTDENLPLMIDSRQAVKMIFGSTDRKHYYRLYEMIERKEIGAKKLGDRWFILGTSVKKLIDENTAWSLI